MPSIFGMIPDALRSDLDAALSAVKGDTYALIRRVTTDAPATSSSPVTDWIMYDAAANPADAVLYSECKAGNLPETDQLNGNPIDWDAAGLTEQAAITAFAAFQFWLNDSEIDPQTFVLATMAVCDPPRAYVPDEA
jgi:hypothetical protein